MKKITLFPILFISVLLYSKDPNYKNICIYKSSVDIIKKSPFYWYGIDVSMMRLVEGKRMDMKDRIAHQYCPAWINEFNDKGTKYRLSWYYENKNISIVADKFGVNRIDNIDLNSIVDYKKKAYSIDSITECLKSYKLDEKEGIGFVFILGNLIKEDEKVEGYSVFFDIKTREAMWVCRTYSNASGKGLTGHWSEGMFRCFGLFISEFYKYE